MTFEFKDLLSLLILSGTCASLWFKLGNRVVNAEKSISTVKKILFKENGELAFITGEQCAKRQAILQKAQEQSDIRYANIEKELRDLSNNVLIIMVHLGIEDGNITKKRGASNG
ncbi:MAG: hypothetical protein GWM98_02080 [Nitrospinaceae bacterium]|nr:hypothetical protein [Nitrospinaceae bacterium]